MVHRQLADRHAVGALEKLRSRIPLGTTGGVPPLAALVDWLPRRKARTMRSNGEPVDRPLAMDRRLPVPADGRLSSVRTATAKDPFLWPTTIMRHPGTVPLARVRHGEKCTSDSSSSGYFSLAFGELRRTEFSWALSLYWGVSCLLTLLYAIISVGMCWVGRRKKHEE